MKQSIITEFHVKPTFKSTSSRPLEVSKCTIFILVEAGTNAEAMVKEKCNRIYRKGAIEFYSITEIKKWEVLFW